MVAVDLPRAPWRIGVDVGGTFTDLVLADAVGATWVTKIPTDPAEPERGVLVGLERLSSQLGVPTGELLARCALFLHGSTVATNTVLEGKGARVGLLCTRGFRDVLEIRRGARENQWDHRTPYPPVLVPRWLRLPVSERILADSSEELPLDAGDVTAAAAVFRESGVEAVAVAFLNSFLDMGHEQAAGGLLASEGFPWVSLSAGVAPVLGEYQRTSTAVVNASLAPRIVPYLEGLEEKLRAAGLRGPLLLVQSNGGTASVAQLSDRPVNLLLSGPAAGAGALGLVRRLTGTDDLLSMEIGGTSCDVLLMAKGRTGVKDDLMIGGYHVATPALDIHTVGAGGGTIARVDPAGMLLVGPDGAGADPGPAGYGLGGTEPTVTDAHLVLGRLRAGPLGGDTSVSLDLDLARRAIGDRIARPLGLSVEEAAAGIISVVEQHLLHAVERLSVERGWAPSRFTLVAAGGAGPLHGASIGRSLGCRRVYAMRDAGAFCALGMLEAPLRQDALQVLLADLDAVEPHEVDDRFSHLASRVAKVLSLADLGGYVQLQRSVDLRYGGQLWSVPVDVPDGRFDPAALRAAFEADYDRLYGHVQPGGTIQITALRVVGTVSAPALATRTAQSDVQSGTLHGLGGQQRPVWHGVAAGWLDTAVLPGRALAPGLRFHGPAVVEEDTTTILVGPDDELVVDVAGNYVLELEPEVRP